MDHSYGSVSFTLVSHVGGIQDLQEATHVLSSAVGSS